jgi:thioesterase domain-containing protein
MGGALALEIARRLRHEREEIAELVAIDALPELACDGASLNGGALLRELGWRGGATEVDDADPSDAAGLVAIVGAARARGLAPAGVDAGYVERLARVWCANARALAAHRARAYDGGAMLILSSSTAAALDGAPAAAWRRVARAGVDVRVVSGDHDSILARPHVAEVARIIQSARTTPFAVAG